MHPGGWTVLNEANMDVQFQLWICKLASDDACIEVLGEFMLPANGKQHWAASLTI
jgi:hypothetical protein